MHWLLTPLEWLGPTMIVVGAFGGLLVTRHAMRGSYSKRPVGHKPLTELERLQVQFAEGDITLPQFEAALDGPLERERNEFWRELDARVDGRPVYVYDESSLREATKYMPQDRLHAAIMRRENGEVWRWDTSVPPVSGGKYPRHPIENAVLSGHMTVNEARARIGHPRDRQDVADRVMRDYGHLPIDQRIARCKDEIARFDAEAKATVERIRRIERQQIYAEVIPTVSRRK